MWAMVIDLAVLLRDNERQFFGSIGQLCALYSSPGRQGLSAFI
jgi:hypothetical protein